MFHFQVQLSIVSAVSFQRLHMYTLGHVSNVKLSRLLVLLSSSPANSNSFHSSGRKSGGPRRSLDRCLRWRAGTANTIQTSRRGSFPLTKRYCNSNFTYLNRHHHYHRRRPRLCFKVSPGWRDKGYKVLLNENFLSRWSYWNAQQWIHIACDPPHRRHTMIEGRDWTNEWRSAWGGL